MQKTVDGKNYYTFEYELTSPNFSTTSFATIAIANGKCHYHNVLYHLIWVLPSSILQYQEDE